MEQVQITKLSTLNLLVIKKMKSNFFRTTEDSIVISTFNLSSLIKYMLFKGIINPKLLEGILEEYYDANNNLGSTKRW